MTERPLSLFEGYGIEIEHVVVDAESLDVKPVVDELLRAAAGGEEWVEDFDDGPIGWSNELVAHVVELKTNGPAPSLEGVAEAFRASVHRMNAHLAEGWGARLLPSGMHPWMDPARETRLWPHEHGPVYAEYDRLFDCRRHGWANLQSVHLNLPFADDREFGALLAACRLMLPLVPALAASSPVAEGRATGLLDTRLDVYRSNAQRVPSMAGDVIPEAIFDPDEYRETIFGAIDRELEAAGASEALLGQPFTNARGVIARFDRMALEVRLIDAQECARADLAIAAAVTGVVRALVEERHASQAAQRAADGAMLSALLHEGTRRGPAAELPASYRELLGLPPGARTLGDAWRGLVETTFAGPAELEPALEVVLREGTLAERILAALGRGFDRPRLREVYNELCECLADGRSFLP